MLFKVQVIVSEQELNQVTSYSTIKIIPIMKSLFDDLENEINWINEHKNDCIISYPVDLAYENYKKDFENESILGKNSFSKLAKKELKIQTKLVRIDKNIQNCFVLS